MLVPLCRLSLITMVSPASGSRCRDGDTTAFFFVLGLIVLSPPAAADPNVIAEVSCGLGEAMVGINCSTIYGDKNIERYAARSE